MVVGERHDVGGLEAPIETGGAIDPVGLPSGFEAVGGVLEAQRWH
jgi:hypothetical protein